MLAQGARERIPLKKLQRVAVILRRGSGYDLFQSYRKFIRAERTPFTDILSGIVRLYTRVPFSPLGVIILRIMRQLTFTQTVPLNQDADGSVRVSGSRITLDTLVAAFKKGATAEQVRDSFPSP
ncbi:MAG: hypothetical protein J2P21_13165 [Chloracidobacterium sp.]|nr:hypothetical protein [Chloracidobacterium sp.]